MRYPDRLLGDIASHATHVAGSRITEHTILLGLGFRFRSEKGLTLSEVVEELGFTRRYGRRIAQQFGIAFSDFVPGNPLNLPLE